MLELHDLIWEFELALAKLEGSTPWWSKTQYKNAPDTYKNPYTTKTLELYLDLIKLAEAGIKELKENGVEIPRTALEEVGQRHTAEIADLRRDVEYLLERAKLSF